MVWQSDEKLSRMNSQALLIPSFSFKKWSPITGSKAQLKMDLDNQYPPKLSVAGPQQPLERQWHSHYTEKMVRHSDEDDVASKG